MEEVDIAEPEKLELVENCVVDCVLGVWEVEDGDPLLVDAALPSLGPVGTKPSVPPQSNTVCPDTTASGQSNAVRGSPLPLQVQ